MLVAPGTSPVLFQSVMCLAVAGSTEILSLPGLAISHVVHMQPQALQHSGHDHERVPYFQQLLGGCSSDAPHVSLMHNATACTLVLTLTGPQTRAQHMHFV
jgi:hypothetical protein